MTPILGFLLFLSPIVSDLIKSNIVHTKQGDVQGYVEEIDGKKVDIFLGIPYAQPPIDKTDWFKPTKPPVSWNGTKETTEFTPACWYPFPHDLKNGQSLDCLYLNVYAPERKTNSPLLPVLFYIHGGSYVQETAEHYGDKSVAAILPARHNVIVVTLNYRLGVLGFYSDGSEEAPGNQGLWDMIEALRWTYQNIEKFGGDPNRITVGGHSAGSMSAEILSMSPVTYDMIHQTFLMSGTNDYQWEPIETKDAFNKVLIMATEYLNFTSNSNDTEAELTSFLQSQDPKDFAIWYQKDGEERELKIWPTYDGKILSGTIQNMRKRWKRQPTLVGCTRYEGLLLIDDKDYYEAAIKVVTRHILKSLDFENSKNKKVSKEILSQFLNSTEANDTQLYKRDYMELMSDVFFNTGIYKYAMEHVQVSERPLYVYRFDHYYTGYRNRKVIDGSTHADDIPFIIGQYNINGDKLSYEDKIALEQFSEFVANFVRYGNPNGPVQAALGVEKWLPVQANTDKLHHFVYNYYENHLSDNWFEERHKKWMEIREKYSKSTLKVVSSLVISLMLSLWVVIGM